jgi:DnaJ-class molecular chaperone
MSVTEARAVLGVSAQASRDDIIRAHRRLMQKFHPDRGGNDFLAARINQAKAVLLSD